MDPLQIAILKTVASLTPVTQLLLTWEEQKLAAANDEAQKLTEEYLIERLRTLANRIDSECLNRTEFFDLYKNCTIIFRRTHYKEKLRSAANILTNAMLKEGDPEKLPYRELDHFARCVEHLSMGAIDVLGWAIRRASFPGPGRHSSEASSKHVVMDFGRLRDDMPSSVMSDDLLMGLIGELNSFNLLHLRGVPGVHTEGKKYDNYQIESTPLGYRFTKFILEHSESDRLKDGA